MSSKLSPRTRKHKHKDDPKHETIVQVHKILKSDNTSDSRDNLSSSRTDNSEDGESNKAFQMEDQNENYNHTPSREISVDGESQINSKILSLIETEMKRDINKHSHFTDSRPQSLSFYEDEKIPEELSGNLELLSPEERKHYRRRKEYSQIEKDERNAYNIIQDLYNSRDGEEIIPSGKKSKRKKRHAEPETGIGDSREMMIPKEKKKSKKKRRETSPMASGGKRKHKKRDDEHEARNDISVALEELQDDVFENTHEEQHRPERIKKSPMRSDKLYVQRKNKFEVTDRPTNLLNRQSAHDFGDTYQDNKHPIEIAGEYQRYWIRFSTLCHGLLAGLAFGHWLYLITNADTQTKDFLISYSNYSQVYMCLFYFLIVICLISVFDRIDLAHLDLKHVKDLIFYRQSAFAALFYLTAFIVHLSASDVDNKLAIWHFNNETIGNITTKEIKRWNHLSFWRSFFSMVSWIIIAFASPDNMLYIHLKNMEKYIPLK